MDTTDRPVIAAPPTARPSAIEVREQRSWPTVIGVFGIVLSALGMLQGASSLIGALVMGGMAGVAAPKVAAGFDVAAWQRSMRPAMLTDGGLRIVLGVLLLACGIGVLKRRAWAVPASMAWAVLRMIGGIVSSYLSAVAQSAIMSSMSGAAGGASAAAMAPTMMAMTMLTGILMSCAIPVFVIVWFCLPRVRAEVGRWRREHPGGEVA